jgi:hypothetical protein
MVFTQLIRKNINKIDYDLKQLFETVKISDRAYGNQFYYEIKSNSTFYNLSNCFEYKKAEAKVKILKQDLTPDLITWSYSTNPIDESADWIERTSHIDNIALDIYNIVAKKMMVKEYFGTLEPFYNSINESNQSVEKAETIEDTLSNIVKDLGIGVQSVEKTILEQIEMFSAPDQVIRIHTNKYISLSDMFRLETVLNNKPGVNFTLIREKYIDVNVSPNY